MKTFQKLLILALAISLSAVNLASAADSDLGPTLKAPTTAAAKPSAEGFIQRWILLDPIDVNGLTDSAVQAQVKAKYFDGQFSIVPHDGETVVINGNNHVWHAVETKEYNFNLYHLARALGKHTSNVLFWGVAVVDSPEEMTGVRLAIGSNAASVWWLNDQEVIGIYGDRQTVIDDGVSKRLTLKKGQNIIRCAVVNGGGATDFCARFLDANEKPIKNLTISAGSAAK